MKSRFLKNMLFSLFKNYLIVDRNGSGIIRDGQFSPIDFTRSDIVDKGKYLILEKGKHRISIRPGYVMAADETPSIFVVDNLRDSYDCFWGNKEVVDRYLLDSRLKFYEDVFDRCKQYVRGRVIDIGCGCGAFLELIARLGRAHHVYGVDFSLSAINSCRKRLPDGAFAVADLYAPALKDESIDVMFCLETLEHLEDPGKVIDEMRRVCRRGGYIIITIPNGIYDDYIGHINFWTESEFRQLLRKLEIVDMQYLEGNRTMFFVLRPSS